MMNSFYSTNIEKARFAVKRISYSENKKFVERYIIVLKDIESDLIIKFTDYADYVLYRVNFDTNVFSSNEKYVYAICQFLNFIFIYNYPKYKISSIVDLRFEMFKDFLDDYSSSFTQYGKFPSRMSVNDKRVAISIFGEMLCYYNKKEMKYLKKGQFISETIIKKDNKKTRIYNYALKVKYYDNNRGELVQLYRDMPLGLIDRFLKYAEIYDPELCFAICLQAYAGLREGEICNVRRKGSIYGPGIITTSVKTMDKYGNYIYAPTSFQIDLRQEYLMRKDYINVGKIKCERFVGVWGPFVELVNEYYLKHIQLTKNKEYDTDIQPMFLSRRKNKTTGRYEAMTKDAYTKRVKSLFVKYVLASCEKDMDPDLALFYEQMKNHTWGLHAFRHYFTVFLLYSGVDDIARLMDLRGDKSSESAETYLKRKGVILNTYQKSLEKIAIMIKGRGTI